MICPLCEKKNTTLLFPVGDSDKEVWNIVCKNCALVFLEEIPGEGEYAAYQSESGRGSGHHRARSDEELEQKLYGSDERIKRGAVRFLAPHLKPRARVLDVGCGYGNLLRILKEETGIDGEGLEMNDDDIRIAKERFGINLHRGTIAEFYERAKRKVNYDAIVVHHTLEHLPSPLLELRRMRELLSDDGVLYIAVPNIMNMKKRPESFFILGHAFSYSSAALVSVLAKAGFRTVALNEDAAYPGGMEVIARKASPEGAAQSGGAALRGGDWRAVARAVRWRKRQFDVLRGAKRVLLFWLPRGVRNNAGRFVLKALRRMF